MDLTLLARITQNNSADVEAIISKVGIGTLLQLMPHIMAIVKTVQDTKAQGQGNRS